MESEFSGMLSQGESNYQRSSDLCSSYSSSAEFYIDDSCYGLYQVILENPGGTSHIIGKLNIPNMQNKSQQTNR